MLDVLRMKLPYLWYENEKGVRWVPEDEMHPLLVKIAKALGTYEPPKGHDTPKGFYYQCSRFPNEVHDSIFRGVLQEEVDACDHPEETIKRTGGWINGVKGRECQLCNGTQVVHKNEPWPDKWDANGSRMLMSGASTYSGDLVLAMTRPSLMELARQVYRYGFPAVPFGDYGQAVMYAAVSCEACRNALAYRYGLPWGYPRGSDDWYKAGTSCELCDPQPVKPCVDPDEMC